jgi:hypothetical protein
MFTEPFLHIELNNPSFVEAFNENNAKAAIRFNGWRPDHLNPPALNRTQSFIYYSFLT